MEKNKLLMLALDHRDTFKKLINPKNPDKVTSENIIDRKRKIIKNTSHLFSGALIDPDFGLSAYEGTNKPFLLPSEKTGYAEDPKGIVNEILLHPADVIKLGAKGIKLLIFFNSKVENKAIQLESSKLLSIEAKRANIPFFLEIVQYDDDTPIYEIISAFLDYGIYPSVFKITYPGDQVSCKKTSQACGTIPWIMLTRGSNFDSFCEKLTIASKNGCSGFLAGRALWEDFLSAPDEIFDKFCEEILPERFSKIKKIML